MPSSIHRSARRRCLAAALLAGLAAVPVLTGCAGRARSGAPEIGPVIRRVSVADSLSGAPATLESVNPRPNPFCPRNVLELTYGGVPVDALVSLYDVKGEELCRWPYHLEAGTHEVNLDNAFGRYRLPSGVYFVRVAVGDETLTRKVAFVK